MTVLQGATLLCWLWSSKLLCVVSCLWRGPHGKELREILSRQPTRNWILPITTWAWKWTLPQINVWWEPSSGQFLDFSLAEDLVKPWAFSNAGPWVSVGSHSDSAAQPRMVGELMPVDASLNNGQWRIWVHFSPLPPSEMHSIRLLRRDDRIEPQKSPTGANLTMLPCIGRPLFFLFPPSHPWAT